MDSLENNNVKPAIAASNASQVQYLDHLDSKANSAKLTYYLWISRFFILIATMSIGFLILASLALFRLAPRVTVEPLLLIRNSDSDNLVESEVVATDMASRDELMKMYIRQYITLRNTLIPDKMEMGARWQIGGMVHFLSDVRVYGEFARKALPQWTAINESSSSISTEIISISRQGGAQSRVWHVKFKTYEYTPRTTEGGEQSIKTRYWNASLTTVFNPARAFSFYRLINPLGFTVLRYSQNEE
ncbi:MAG: hypothetical protein IJ184_05885 [Alphaproteobacteria bacterium]|nr:hypothetical protein [Alphaproteobacteria bacterium]